MDVDADAAFNVFFLFFKYRIYIPYLVIFTNMYKMYSFEAAIFPIIARNGSASTRLQTAMKEFFKNLLSR